MRNFFFFAFSTDAGDRKYEYNIDSHSLTPLKNVNFKAIRAKRDTNSPPTTVATNASAPTTATVSSKVAKTETSTTTDSTPHLLGENGHGQRKDYSTINGTTKAPTVSVEPSNADNKATKINKSLGAVATAIPTPITDDIALPGNDDLDRLIGNIDEPEEAINQTITDHINEAKTGKVDYFQYYNSTTIVDKGKSDEYWNAKREYVVSSILSKSHRRAIVSAYWSLDFFGVFDNN